MHSRNLENTRRSCIFSHLNTCHASILYYIMQYKWQPRIFTLAATFSTRRACSAFASPLHESVFLGSSDGSSLEWAKAAAKLLDTVSGGACLLPRDHSTKKITMEIGKKKIAWSWANVPGWHQVMLTRIQKKWKHMNQNYARQNSGWPELWHRPGHETEVCPNPQRGILPKVPKWTKTPQGWKDLFKCVTMIWRLDGCLEQSSYHVISIRVMLDKQI